MLKIFLAPMIDFAYIKKLGKSKTYLLIPGLIVSLCALRPNPTQLTVGCFSVSFFMNDWISEKKILQIALYWIVLICMVVYMVTVCSAITYNPANRNLSLDDHSV